MIVGIFHEYACEQKIQSHRDRRIELLCPIHVHVAFINYQEGVILSIESVRVLEGLHIRARVPNF